MSKSLEELEKESDLLDKEKEEMDKNVPDDLSYPEYCEYYKAINKRLSANDREIRMLKTPTYTTLSTFGDIFTIKNFINNCKCGGFIDYDGFGHYIKDGMESDIEIYPSDVKYNMVRKDFDKIIWFNR